MVPDSDTWVGRVVTGNARFEIPEWCRKSRQEEYKGSARLSEGYRKAMIGVPKGDRISRSGSK